MARRELISEAWEDENIVTRARVLTEAQVPLAPCMCSTWDVYVYDRDDGDVQVYALTAQDPADLVRTNYSTVGWDNDSTGYNVCHGLLDSAWTREGGHTYRIEYKIETNIGEGPISLIHTCRTLPLLNG